MTLLFKYFLLYLGVEKTREKTVRLLAGRLPGSRWEVTSHNTFKKFGDEISSVKRAIQLNPHPIFLTNCQLNWKTMIVQNKNIAEDHDNVALIDILGSSSFHSTEGISAFGASNLSTKSTTSPSAASAAPTFHTRSDTAKKPLVSGRNNNEPQTMEEEVKRLQVLQSYLILDSDREEAFERITSIASRVCNVPIALVSLFDVGRQWFLSNHGMGDVREMPRKNAFCAHVIQNKYNILIVPDATQDARFKDNPLVTGTPHTRFYAGVPLISPERHRLGSVCILSPDARPEGLSQAEQETLHNLSAMAVKALVERRTKLQNRDKQVLLQHTCADVTASLDSIQHSLTSLCASQRVRKQFSKEHLQTMVTLVTASEGVGLNADMCRSTLNQVETKQKALGAKTRWANK